MKIIRVADLFCGAGGTTTGLLQAARDLRLKLNLVAVNHWPLAIQTHMANNPWAQHICASLVGIDPPKDGQKTLFQCIDSVDPLKATKGKKLDLLVASPECTDHSNAKGGKPRNDQSRATPWCILRWAEACAPRHILIENVPEFRNWGPLGARQQPLKSGRGKLFKAFLTALEAVGYAVDFRVLNAADYGDATTRRRLFIQAVRGRRKITWPSPSHAPAEKAEELGLEPWRPARDVIDWSYPGKSIFTRKRPLSPNTIRRIAVGIEKYWGEWAQPFLVMLYGTNDARSIDQPVPTVTAKGQHVGLAEPFLVTVNHGKKDTMKGSVERRCHSVDRPLQTVTCHNGKELVEPFIVPQGGGGVARGVGQPVPTLTTTARGVGLAQAFLIATGQTGAHGPRVQPSSSPVPTIVSKAEQCLVEPFLVPQFGERPGQEPRTHSVDAPVPAVTSHGAGAVVRPFLTKYYRTAGAQDVDEPLDTVTTKERHALVEPGVVRVDGELYALDIRFRMLQPHELAAAMSFPKDYEFVGNKSEKVKQIGNAVAVRVATALCKEAMAS